LTLWSARQGAQALTTALNVTYDVRETRGIVSRLGLTLLVTAGAIAIGVIALVAVVAIPGMLGRLPLGHMGQLAVSAVRWPIMAVVMVAALALAYRYAPNRRRPGWRWVGYGAVAGAVLWLIASALFSLYVTTFAHYNRTYGSLGTIVVLLLWLYISALAVLLGAEFNAAIEQQIVIEAEEATPER